MKRLITSLTILISLISQGQDIYKLADPVNSFVLLNQGWSYKLGDTAARELSNFASEGWKPIWPTVDIHDSISDEVKKGIGWMRLRIKVSTEARKQTLVLLIRQMIASEVYLNGKLLRQFGNISNNPSSIKAFDPLYEPIPIVLSEDSIQLLTVKFAAQPGLKYAAHYGNSNPFFAAMVMRSNIAMEKYRGIFISPWMAFFMAGLTFMAFILHLSFYGMYKVQRANLYFAISSFINFSGNLFHDYYYYGAYPDEKFAIAILVSIFYVMSQVFMLVSVYSYLKIRKRTPVLILVCVQVMGLLLSALWYPNGFLYGLAFMPTLTYFFIIWESIAAQKRFAREARILTIGFITSIISYYAFLSFAATKTGDYVLNTPLFNIASLFYLVFHLSPLASLSIFLAYDFAKTSSRLQSKLSEVEILSQQNVAAEKEKQELLASQNEQLEKKVSERTAALKQSLEELKTTQHQLIQSEKMASLGELTAGIAHEIQNPLNFVNNFSEVGGELLNELVEKVEKGDTAEARTIANEVLQNLEKILHHGKRADAIVKGMLQHSMTSTGQKEPIDINALADEYFKLAYHGLRAKDKSFNAILKTDFDTSINKVNVIPQDIGRAILNLVNNAFYAVNEKRKQHTNGYEPQVVITSRNKGDKIEIVVRDNGNGIPSRMLDKIFQPFFTTKPAGQGTGLGLSMAYEIVTKGHNGELKVETKEGEGTLFIIQLPIS